MRNLRLVLLLAGSVMLLPFATGAQSHGAPSYGVPSCTSSIRVFFDRYGMTHVQTGSTIWFTSVLKAVRNADGRAIKTPIRIDVINSRITFGRWPYVITMPNSTIVLDPSINVPHRLWDGPGQLNVAYAPAQVAHEALFDALPYMVPEPFIPRFSGPVTWTATFNASRPGVTLVWAWSAAAYSQFGRVGTLQLKPLSGPIPAAEPQAGPPDLYENNDPAGTAEAFKQYVIAGAMGRGAPHYTGARSDTATVTACPAPISPSQQIMPRQQIIFPQATRRFSRVSVPWTPFDPAPFAAHVSQAMSFADGSVAQAVDRCYAFDLCAQIVYPGGGRLSMYSEGAAWCQPYQLEVVRSFGDRTLFAVTRSVDHDPPGAFGCGRSRTTQIPIDGGRAVLSISENSDGTLNLHFDTPK